MEVLLLIIGIIVGASTTFILRNKKIVKLQKEIRQQKREIEKYDQEYSLLEQDYNVELNKQIKVLNEKHQAEIEDLDKIHNQQLERITQQYESEIQAIINETPPKKDNPSESWDKLNLVSTTPTPVEEITRGNIPSFAIPKVEEDLLPKNTYSVAIPEVEEDLTPNTTYSLSLTDGDYNPFDIEDETSYSEDLANKDTLLENSPPLTSSSFDYNPFDFDSQEEFKVVLEEREESEIVSSDYVTSFVDNVTQSSATDFEELSYDDPLHESLELQENQVTINTDTEIIDFEELRRQGVIIPETPVNLNTDTEIIDFEELRRQGAKIPETPVNLNTDTEMMDFEEFEPEKEMTPEMPVIVSSDTEPETPVSLNTDTEMMDFEELEPPEEIIRNIPVSLNRNTIAETLGEQPIDLDSLAQGFEELPEIEPIPTITTSNENGDIETFENSFTPQFEEVEETEKISFIPFYAPSTLQKTELYSDGYLEDEENFISDEKLDTKEEELDLNIFDRDTQTQFEDVSLEDVPLNTETEIIDFKDIDIESLSKGFEESTTLDNIPITTKDEQINDLEEIDIESLAQGFEESPDLDQMPRNTFDSNQEDFESLDLNDYTLQPSEEPTPIINYNNEEIIDFQQLYFETSHESFETKTEQLEEPELNTEQIVDFQDLYLDSLAQGVLDLDESVPQEEDQLFVISTDSNLEDFELETNFNEEPLSVDNKFDELVIVDEISDNFISPVVITSEQNIEQEELQLLEIQNDEEESPKEFMFDDFDSDSFEVYDGDAIDSQIAQFIKPQETTLPGQYQQIESDQEISFDDLFTQSQPKEVTDDLFTQSQPKEVTDEFAALFGDDYESNSNQLDNDEDEVAQLLSDSFYQDQTEIKSEPQT